MLHARIILDFPPPLHMSSRVGTCLYLLTGAKPGEWTSMPCLLFWVRHTTFIPQIVHLATIESKPIDCSLRPYLKFVYICDPAD
jgi:hypothetical protein